MDLPSTTSLVQRPPSAKDLPQPPPSQRPPSAKDLPSATIPANARRPRRTFHQPPPRPTPAVREGPSISHYRCPTSAVREGPSISHHPVQRPPSAKDLPSATIAAQRPPSAKDRRTRSATSREERSTLDSCAVATTPQSTPRRSAARIADSGETAVLASLVFARLR